MSSAGENSTKYLKGCQSGISDSKEHINNPNPSIDQIDENVANKIDPTNVTGSLEIEACVSPISSPAPVKKPKPRSLRCFECNKKCGLLIFHCKCLNSYCMDHKASAQHDCKFDFKSDMQEKMRMKSEPVVAKQIPKF